LLFQKSFVYLHIFIYRTTEFNKTMITTTTYQYKQQPKGGKTLTGLAMSYHDTKG